MKKLIRFLKRIFKKKGSADSITVNISANTTDLKISIEQLIKAVNNLKISIG